MTASRSRRRRRTILGALLALALTTVAGVATVVGVLTLRDSQEGETVGVDLRPVVRFPATPNLALAVADDEGRLVSLVIATLLPDGEGGSIVTVPVNADATIGLGEDRQPINTVFSADDPEAFGEIVESLLSVTVERVEVAGPDRLREIIEPLGPVPIELREDVVDSDTAGSGIVAAAGEQTLRTSVVVDALTAVDESRDTSDQHQTKVDLWSALAAEAPIDSAALPEAFDGNGLQVAPETTDEFLARLWSGPVKVRDLDVDPGLLALAENTEGVDMVVIDRRDSLLVFTQVSPSLVSTPNDGLTFRLEVRLSDEQLAATGDPPLTRSQVSRTLVGELLFFSANVISVDTAPLAGGAPEVTRIEVSQERFIDDLIEFAPLVFGESEVVVAPVRLDGVDVVVKVGAGFLDVKRGSSGATVDDG